MATKRRENGPKRLAGNNEAQTLSGRMPRASAKGPLLAHLINTFIASVTPVHRLSGSSDVTGAPLTSCHDKTKRPQNHGEDIDRHPRALAARTCSFQPDNVFPVPTAVPRSAVKLRLSDQNSRRLNAPRRVLGQSGDTLSIFKNAKC